MQKFETSKLIRSEDMNHHETLFAGRMIGWMVEAAFIGASHLYGKYGEADHLVSIEAQSIKFLGPAFNGDIVKYVAIGIKAGRTSLVMHVKALRNNTDHKIAEGFVSFVTIDGNKMKIPHNIILGEPTTEEEKELVEKYNRLRSK